MWLLLLTTDSLDWAPGSGFCWVNNFHLEGVHYLDHFWRSQGGWNNIIHTVNCKLPTVAARWLLWAEAGGANFKSNSEKDKEGGWRCEGPFLTPKIVCSSSPSRGQEEVIWKNILMSPHSSLLELSLHREAELSAPLQHLPLHQQCH